LQINYECEYLVNKLAELVRHDESKLKCMEFGRQVAEKINHLSECLNECLLHQVADDFLDINSPIKKLSDIVLSSLNENVNILDLKEKFEKISNDFIQHTYTVCNTAVLVSSSDQQRNKQNAELISELVNRVNFRSYKKYS
jgi:hypothetical protein